MTHQIASDPHAKPRDLWRAMRRRMRWLLWWAVWFDRLGLLDRSGAAARWFAKQLAMSEHGLRCLLVIGAQRLRRAPRASSYCEADLYSASSRFGGAAGETGTHFSYVTERGGVGLRICDAQARLGEDHKCTTSPLGGNDESGCVAPRDSRGLENTLHAHNRLFREGGSPWISACAENAEERFGADLPPRAFSLSLAAFNLPPAAVVPDPQRLGLHLPAAQRARQADGASDGLSPVEVDAPSYSAHPGESRDLVHKIRSVSTDPGLRRDEHVNARADEQAGLASRLAAIFDVLANPDHHIARMARHIARRGIKLKPRPTTRPANVLRTRWSAAVRTAQNAAIEVADNCATFASTPPDTS